MRLCTVNGCDRPLRARGWCATHYARWSRTGSHLTVRLRYPHRDLMTRVSERVVIDSDTGCHIWQGAVTAAGYGELSVDGRVRLIHRAVYETQRGSIADGFDIHHTCERRACCNPEHLRALAHADHTALHKTGRES